MASLQNASFKDVLFSSVGGDFLIAYLFILAEDYHKKLCKLRCDIKFQLVRKYIKMFYNVMKESH